jgi:hypothetical protein
MSAARTEALSPIDAATLWPQLPRLSTEVVATRSGENLLLAAGIAATGLTILPRMSRTIVVGMRRALGYRGVLVVRELSGGAAWEALSLRLVRETDQEAVADLLRGAGVEVARRGGRSIILRLADASPYLPAANRGGFMTYRKEQLFAIPPRPTIAPEGFRAIRRNDRHSVFRLYCRAVPEHIRRVEAPTQQDWRGILDSYDCEREFVAEGERGTAAWAGAGDREARIMSDWSVTGLDDAALDLIEAHSPRHGTLVLGEEQESLARRALERGYPALGMRIVLARRLAALSSLKEAVPAVVEPQTI